MINKDYKITYILLLIAIVIGYVAGISVIFTTANFPSTINGVSSGVGYGYALGIISIIYISIFIYYLNKIKSDPKVTDFSTILILGILGIFLNWISAVLIIVCAILGLIETNNKDKIKDETQKNKKEKSKQITKKKIVIKPIVKTKIKETKTKKKIKK